MKKDRETNTPSEESWEHTIAEIYTMNETQVSISLKDLTGGVMGGLSEFHSAVTKEIDKIISPDAVESQRILAGNVLSLNALTSRMLGCAARTPTLELMEAHAAIGLKAQEQMRKTIETLNQLQHPKQNTYVAQQNIAEVQQVNNHLDEKGKNQLLSGETYAALDKRGADEAISNDPRAQAMADLYGAQNDRGEGKD